MSGIDWRIKGDYFETCSCDYLCPCIFTNMTAMPTDGVCKVAIVMDIAEGHYGEVDLGGVAFVTAAMVEGPMGDGGWTVGLIIDERATDAQVEALGRICSGDEGRIERRAMWFSITAGDLLSHGAEGFPSLPDPEQPIYIDNTGHPANKRLALAKGTHSRLQAFGIDWDDAAGGHNGHFAPFDWRPA